jgi:sulfite reductase (NADPH) flavoprotein alpha-component
VHRRRNKAGGSRVRDTLTIVSGEPAPPDPRVGSTLQGRYLILSRIASGARGVVYKGERVQLGRSVAVKFLHPWIAAQKTFLSRFENEAKAMSRLLHPHCVSVIDFGVEGSPYLVMDFVTGRTLREVLLEDVSLSPAPDSLFELISYLTGGDRRQKAKALANGGDPDGDGVTIDVLAALQKFPGVRPDPEAFIESLDPLQPRVYSISSSLKANPGRVSLTVDAVRYEVDGRTRLGVCSTFLSGRAAPGDRLRVYVQKAAHFALPADPSKPVIMIGPGTGVAPFRAFLQERQATKASGKNWLFFGHQRRDFDFFYEDEFTAMKSAGLLTRLTLAWSRDAGEKIYVQHRMREVGRDLWAWLNDGAHVYVCGDALKMAKDVEAALIAIIAEHGGCTPETAATMLTELKTKGRYSADVY